jgi:hypothetical protein
MEKLAEKNREGLSPHLARRAAFSLGKGTGNVKS